TDLNSMIQYVETDKSRMKFLCDYLGDTSNHTFNNCDNTGEKKIKVIVTPEWIEKLNNFREDYFPQLEVESKGSNIVNGIATSYYGFSNVGAAIHRSKYEAGGDFPDFLLKLFLKAFRKKFGQEIFDLVVYIPPTSSGSLVKNFAIKIAQVLKFSISHNLQKVKETQEQKVFENSVLKSDNVKDAFTFTTPDEVTGKKILLIDDVFDSGATIKEAGRLLTNFGAIKIAPIVIAKTIGGDLV
ncbi:MAG: RecQ family ATP-dependent DNA helicase, partial [Bacteroidota bacterium]|nr:RecQ family ATP-dependent DNA helicase [Bacteroidota bacterium]